MIEKLETIKAFNCSDTPQAKMQHHNYHNDCIKKINELVDAVNELKSAKDVMFNRIDRLNDAICDVRIIITALEDPAYHKAEPEPADPYAEQRKWIGTLCKFRDKDYKDDQWDYGLLQAVEKAETAYILKTGCFKHNLGHWYDYCEPVKPDDDIIYKGE